MGTCNLSGKSSFEQIVDSFFSSMKISVTVTCEIITILEKNINQGNFCENNFDIFKAEILPYLAKCSDPEFINYTILLWENAFKDFNDSLTFQLLSTIVLLSKGNHIVKAQAISKLYNILKVNKNSDVFLKEHLKTMLNFYINFVSFYALNIIKEISDKREFYPTLLVVYQSQNRETLCEMLTVDYIFFEINLNEYLSKEIKHLHQETIRNKLFEINCYNKETKINS